MIFELEWNFNLKWYKWGEMETIFKRRPLFVYMVITSAIVSPILLFFANHGNSLVNNGLADIEGFHRAEDVMKPMLHISDIDRWVTLQSYFKKLCELDRYIFNEKRDLE